jgi:hypothetical protein
VPFTNSSCTLTGKEIKKNARDGRKKRERRRRYRYEKGVHEIHLSLRLLHLHLLLIPFGAQDLHVFENVLLSRKLQLPFFLLLFVILLLLLGYEELALVGLVGWMEGL